MCAFRHQVIRITFAILACLLFSDSFGDDSQPDSDRLRHFETHIRPLIHAKCVKCHGENQQEGGLRLDSIEAITTGGESGAAVVPGHAADSLMLEAVRYESLEMPPDKPLSAAEIAHLERWITDGAVWPKANGKSVRLTGAAFSKDDREFWSLQPITHPEPPSTSASWARNPIDRFVAAKLQAAQIEAAPPTDEDVLLRRVYFDLLGVPPSPTEIADFKRQRLPQGVGDESTVDGSATAFANLVDKLLQDHRYGEHWARYWLDIVRYAESDGFRADTYRENAWRYRDYVINAFNNDKPYDQFVMEQLAGDEVAPDKAEALVATGYLRAYLYEYNQRDARTQWQDILNQVTDVTGEAFLGFGVGCARCHDHKFDPILQEDYYRLRASFGTMIPRDDVPAADLVDRNRYALQYKTWLAKGAKLRDDLRQLKQPYIAKATKNAIKIFPEDIQVIMAKASEDRNPLEAQLADLVDRQIQFDVERIKYKESDKLLIDELEAEIKKVAGNQPAKLPTAITVADVGNQPFPLPIGDNKNRRAVSAGGFSILDSAAFDLNQTQTSTGQRTALAKWITDPQNPLAARVIVNRIWQQHFGTGLVTTASDFGNLGGRPSHLELLDWLATEFVAHGWSIHWLQRMILTSGTWQMSSFHNDAAHAETIDPANRLRWRFDIRRLKAEQIRDAMLTSSGELTSEIGGPSVAHTSLRRSIYLKMMRNQPEPLLNSLDGVDGLNSISKRSTTTTPTQALNLMNGDWVRERSMAMAKRVFEQASSLSPEDLAESAFRLALGRRPDDHEISAARQLISQASAARDAATPNKRLTELSPHTGASIDVGDTGVTPPNSAVPHPQMQAPFSFVGVVQLDSIFPSASVRTIISQWDNSKSTKGWSFGVTGEKSGFKPRNLILQPITDTGYEVVASNLRPELNKPYFVAVTVSVTENGKGSAKFYLQPINPSDGKLQTSTVKFKSATGLQNNLPVVVGGRSISTGHNWDGRLDQISLFSRRLSSDQITKLFNSSLKNEAIIQLQPTAFWNFDNEEIPGTAAVGTVHPLQFKDSEVSNPLLDSLAELCHVLLNSNEFVYVD